MLAIHYVGSDAASLAFVGCAQEPPVVAIHHVGRDAASRALVGFT